MLVPLFKDRDHYLFGRAGIGCALQNYQLTRAQMRRNRLGRIRDVAQVGLVVFVQRRGDTDDDGIHLAQARIV